MMRENLRKTSFIDDFAYRVIWHVQDDTERTIKTLLGTHCMGG